MKLSVLMVTYNHEKYIGQALDSVLMQKVTFPYEIVIGDDFSTDKTREIIVDYAVKHPDKIRLLLHERNLGLGGKNNFIHTLKACVGEYVAILEGDDYWTDPHKLQKQVELMDEHPQCAICIHDVQEFHQNLGEIRKSIFPEHLRLVTQQKDLLKGNYIYTCSVMYRKQHLHELPPWYYDTISLADFTINVLCSHYGDIRYIDNVMAVYRIHRSGMWTQMTISEKIKDHIIAYRNFCHYLDKKSIDVCKETLNELLIKFTQSTVHGKYSDNVPLEEIKRQALIDINNLFNGSLPPFEPDKTLISYVNICLSAISAKNKHYVDAVKWFIQAIWMAPKFVIGRAWTSLCRRVL
jgi:glycosyltransferase involved in cell wall biosynthesis